MMENIIVGVLILASVGTCIWVWWVENHGKDLEKKEDVVDKEDEQNGETK